jgi:TrmH family RNA methyltransferase
MRRAAGSHPALEDYRKLHSRRARDESRTFLVEGIGHVAAALDAGAHLRSLAVCREMLDHPGGRGIVRRLRSEGRPVLDLSPDEFRSISILGEPQGIAAIVGQSWSRLPASTRRGGEVRLAFGRVRSPGNLGTAMRTARATGARGVVLIGGKADPFDPRAVRPTMGAIFHLELVRCDLDELDRFRRLTGARVVGAAVDARVDFRTHRFRGSTVLLLGDERTGLTREQRRLCDDLVRIPMRRGVDSLNLGVAASLLLYEAFRRHDPPRLPRRRRARG